VVRPLQRFAAHHCFDRKQEVIFHQIVLVGELDSNIQSYAVSSYTVSVQLSTTARASLTAQTYTFVDSSGRFLVTYAVPSDALDLVTCQVTSQVEARLNKLFRAAFLY
jgi:hypothetical protein